jgi:ABC-type proline/glycine betaine transport system permease subunit
MGTNRLAIFGSLFAAWGFFFLPLLILIPNRQAVENVSFQLLELQSDYRYFFLFLLCWVPLFIAFESNVARRGWLLVGFGNLIMILSIWLPAIAAAELIQSADELLPNSFVRNPRVRPVSAILVGIAGGYIILFGGLRDLKSIGVGQQTRLAASFAGVAFMYYLFIQDYLDVYSVVVEYNIRGETLFEDIIKHLTYVLVALAAGLVIGIGLGLWASRQERVAPIILYIVGIIQTIPSLALFGILLVPLSQLGQLLLVDDILIFLIPALLLLGVLLYIIGRLDALGERFQFIALIALGAVMAVPVLLATLMIISIVFQIGFDILISSDYQLGKTVFILFAVAAMLLAFSARRLRVFRRNELLAIRLHIVLLVGMLLSGGYVFGVTGNDYLPIGTALNEWTLSDIGIRGLGETPSLVALSLYSLLPLVRNTYTGLNNVDDAIIDSGKGMGMTPRQIFFKIELPLAFPVIMAGVRNAAIALVGIATIAATIGGGALGDYVLDGANNIALDLILLGTIPAIILAFALDAGLRALEIFLTSPGVLSQQEKS